MVRAKFRLNSYETRMHSKWENGKEISQIETRTLKFSVVSSGSEENKAFFASTPTGELTLSTVNPEAWQNFELNKEYYLDFTLAD